MGEGQAPAFVREQVSVREAVLVCTWEQTVGGYSCPDAGFRLTRHKAPYPDPISPNNMIGLQAKYSIARRKPRPNL
jgi:hypothetical protein